MARELECVREELRAARLHSSAGALIEAERHIRKALAKFDALPRDSLTRAVRSYIAEAGFAITQGNSQLATSAIDEALHALDENLNPGD